MRASLNFNAEKLYVLSRDMFHAMDPEVVVTHFSSVPLLSLLDLTALMIGGEDAAPIAVMVSVDVGQEIVVVAGVPALLHSVDEPPAVVLLLLALVQLRRRPPLFPFSRVGDFTSNTDVSLSMSDSTCNNYVHHNTILQHHRFLNIFLNVFLILSFSFI